MSTKGTIANKFAMEFILPRVTGGKVLEVGSRWSELPSILTAKGCEVTAIDRDPQVVEWQNERMAQCWLRWDVLIADAKSLPWEYGTFDFVTAVFALQHILEGQIGDIDAYCECARVLKHGGHLLLVQSHAKETRIDMERVDPQRINSTRDVFQRIIQPSRLTLVEIESYNYNYEANTGEWASLEQSNAICLHLVKE